MVKSTSYRTLPLDDGKPCMRQTTRSVSASQLAYEWKNNDKRCWWIRGQGPTPLSQRIPLCYDISGGKKITIVTSEDRCSGHSFILGYHRWILLWPSKAIASNQSATCTIHHLHPQTFQWLWHQWNLQTRNGVEWILQVWTWSLSVFFRHVIWMLLVANMYIKTHPFMSLGGLPAPNLVSMRHIQWTST